MIPLIHLLILSIIAGIFVKSVDWIEDDLEKSKREDIMIKTTKWVLAISYGILLGYIISNSTFSTIFLAAIFAQIFSKKIDTHAHVIGTALAIILTAFFGVPSIDFTLFILFIIAASLDEIEYVGKLKPLSDYRPFLKIAALFPIIFGRFDYALGLYSFDIGYMATDKALSSLKKPAKESKKQKKKQKPKAEKRKTKKSRKKQKIG